MFRQIARASRTSAPSRVFLGHGRSLSVASAMALKNGLHSTEFKKTHIGLHPMSTVASPAGVAMQATSHMEMLRTKLSAEPQSYKEVWEGIVRDQKRVDEKVFESLFKALSKTAIPGAMLPAARAYSRMIYEGTAKGLITIDTRCSAFVSLLKWCESEEELGDYAVEVIDQISDEDRAHSAAVMASIGSVFCAGTRSPY